MVLKMIIKLKFISIRHPGKLQQAHAVFLMYHELAHDILNLDDLEMNPSHERKLMYPAINTYENVSMDDFIEAFKKHLKTMQINHRHFFI